LAQDSCLYCILKGCPCRVAHLFCRACESEPVAVMGNGPSHESDSSVEKWMASSFGCGANDCCSEGKQHKEVVDVVGVESSAYKKPFADIPAAPKAVQEYEKGNGAYSMENGHVKARGLDAGTFDSSGNGQTRVPADYLSREYLPRELTPVDVHYTGEAGQFVDETPPPPPPRPQAAELNIVFEPGSVGMHADWHDGLVKTVNEGEQAHRLGVRSGMRLLTVDGRPYTESRLDVARVGTKRYEVTVAQAQQPPARVWSPRSDSKVQSPSRLQPLHSPDAIQPATAAPTTPTTLEQQQQRQLEEQNQMIRALMDEKDSRQRQELQRERDQHLQKQQHQQTQQELQRERERERERLLELEREREQHLQQQQHQQTQQELQRERERDRERLLELDREREREKERERLQELERERERDRERERLLELDRERERHKERARELEREMEMERERERDRERERRLEMDRQPEPTPYVAPEFMREQQNKLEAMKPPGFLLPGDLSMPALNTSAQPAFAQPQTMTQAPAPQSPRMSQWQAPALGTQAFQMDWSSSGTPLQALAQGASAPHFQSGMPTAAAAPAQLHQLATGVTAGFPTGVTAGFPTGVSQPHFNRLATNAGSPMTASQPNLNQLATGFATGSPTTVSQPQLTLPFVQVSSPSMVQVQQPAQYVVQAQQPVQFAVQETAPYAVRTMTPQRSPRLTTSVQHATAPPLRTMGAAAGMYQSPQANWQPQRSSSPRNSRPNLEPAMSVFNGPDLQGLYTNTGATSLDMVANAAPVNAPRTQLYDPMSDAVPVMMTNY